MATMTATSFLQLEQEMTARRGNLNPAPSIRRFRSFFGTSPHVCAILWGQLQSNIPEQGRPEHMLWALLLLKVYGTEDVVSSIVQVSRKTFRKWSWKFISAISYLANVSDLSH